MDLLLLWRTFSRNSWKYGEEEFFEGIEHFGINEKW